MEGKKDRWKERMEGKKDRWKERRIDGRKEGNVLFNNALKTFDLWLCGVGYKVKDHSDSGRGNLLLTYGLLFLIPQTG